jgi:protein O-GlcNAc transferase
MIPLEGKNSDKYGEIIKSHGIHVLIDLNGHTLNSGLGAMVYRPAPIQVSLLYTIIHLM